MEQATCLNCGAVLTPGQNYCYNCGQRQTHHAFLSGIFSRIFYRPSHAGRGILNLVKGLTINPGRTAVEYIQGKRKKYFNPFAFLGLCIAFMVFLNNWIKLYNDLPTPDPQVMARIPDEKLRQLYLVSIERNVRAQKFVSKNLNIASVLVAPYFAFSYGFF
jgi:Protein of unknown function (DUF3667)